MDEMEFYEAESNINDLFAEYTEFSGFLDEDYDNDYE
jgi:hypothetical protein